MRNQLIMQYGQEGIGSESIIRASFSLSSNTAMPARLSRRLAGRSDIKARDLVIALMASSLAPAAEVEEGSLTEQSVGAETEGLLVPSVGMNPYPISQPLSCLCALYTQKTSSPGWRLRRASQAKDGLDGAAADGIPVTTGGATADGATSAADTTTG